MAREAVAACLKVTEWIQPCDDDAVALHEGVGECVALLQSNLNFRGFLVRSNVADVEFEVSRVALRNLLSASLITLSDAGNDPCTLGIEADVSAGAAVLTVRRGPRDDGGPGMPPDVTVYRQLDWADVQALAVAEDVELTRAADVITMRIPRMVATSPLQIAPL